MIFLSLPLSFLCIWKLNKSSVTVNYYTFNWISNLNMSCLGTCNRTLHFLVHRVDVLFSDLPAKDNWKAWTLHIKQTYKDLERWRQESRPTRILRPEKWHSGEFPCSFLPHISQTAYWESWKPSNTNENKQTKEK